MIVLIPAFEPGSSLPRLISELTEQNPDVTIIVVDDGSGAEYRPVFDQAARLEAIVLTLPTNRGKGAALKAGFAWIKHNHPGESIVCADSDGQHRPADIKRVVEQVEERGAEPAIVLGSRRFTGRVPARSRFGNGVSRQLFRTVTGLSIHDTQTGLRGYPASLLDWLVDVDGERFEYELNILLDAARDHVPVVEVEIETLYLGHNESSHFRPIVDSLRVMRPLAGYVVSSLAAFFIDLAALQVLFTITGSLLISVIGARLISATINFLVNRYFVFSATERRSGLRHAVRYAALAGGMVLANFGALSAATAVGIPLIPAKIVIEATFYFVSFQVQRLFVFRALRRAETPGVVHDRVGSTISAEHRDGAISQHSLSHADSS